MVVGNGGCLGTSQNLQSYRAVGIVFFVDIL